MPQTFSLTMKAPIIAQRLTTPPHNNPFWHHGTQKTGGGNMKLLDSAVQYPFKKLFSRLRVKLLTPLGPKIEQRFNCPNSELSRLVPIPCRRVNCGPKPQT